MEPKYDPLLLDHFAHGGVELLEEPPHLLVLLEVELHLLQLRKVGLLDAEVGAVGDDLGLGLQELVPLLPLLLDHLLEGNGESFGH